jgi:mono/diheme cytochrome c family protein
MKLHTLLVLGITFAIAGCAEKEPATPEEVIEEPAAEVAEAVPAAEAEAALAQAEDWRNSAFMEHMHAHADFLDDLNYALDDGDLEMAMPPAYWLSRHDTVSGLPEELQPYLVNLREAARAVEAAEDVDAARAAAQKIAKQCQACHAAAGVSVE